jgi:hypothetical protein
MTRLPFDRVSIRQGSLWVQLTVEAFLGLPLSERIRLVLSRSIEFYDGDKQVERGSALASLREAAASPAASQQ